MMWESEKEKWRALQGCLIPTLIGNLLICNALITLGSRLHPTLQRKVKETKKLGCYCWRIQRKISFLASNILIGVIGFWDPYYLYNIGYRASDFFCFCLRQSSMLISSSGSWACSLFRTFLTSPPISASCWAWSPVRQPWGQKAGGTTLGLASWAYGHRLSEREV